MPVQGAYRHTQVEVTTTGYTVATDVCLKIPISFEDVSGVVATLPANCLITSRQVVRTTPWNILALFAAGKADDLDWLVQNYQHNLSQAFAGATEITGGPIYVAAETPIVFTWDQGGATAGEGYVVVCYTMLEAAP
jgi:hypothetical protein